MIIFSLGAFAIFKITQRREPFYIYAGVGLAMLAAAIFVEIREGAVLTIAYTVESGIIPIILYFVLKDIRVARRASLILMGPALLSLGSIMSRSWTRGILHEDFFVLLFLGLIFLGLGLFFWEKRREQEEAKPPRSHELLLAAGSMYLYILLWLSLHTLLKNSDIAAMISLVVYTIIGIFSYSYGKTKEKIVLSFYGGALLGIVVTRLLIIDVWRMELTGRIITFFLVGFLFIVTAFLGRKKKTPLAENYSTNNQQKYES